MLNLNSNIQSVNHGKEKSEKSPNGEKVFDSERCAICEAISVSTLHII